VIPYGIQQQPLQKFSVLALGTQKQSMGINTHG